MRTIRLLLMAALGIMMTLLLPGTASASAPQALVTYMVVDGDWLSKIASRQCGSASRWSDIYELNRGVVGANPNLIYPKQRLTLPAGCLGISSSGPSPRVTTPRGGVWRSPLASYRITTCYEWRRALYVNGKLISKAGLHGGLDMSAAGGTRVSAVASGRVIRAGWRGGYGRAVEVSHGGGVTSMYGHLSSISVQKNQWVSVGGQVGRVGTSGNSTGYHLHLGMYRYGAHFNPTPYLEARGVPIRGC